MKLIINITILFISIFSYSQITLKGVITENETGKPLENVIIVDIATQKWTLSDASGVFVLPTSNQNSITLSFRLLGKKEETLTIKSIDFNKPLALSMKVMDLRLDEVVVTARKGKNYSEITLGREAINQVQAFSINEVLQQLPGQAVTNFNLSEFKTIAFRTVQPSNISNNSFGNKSFGTAIVVDGIPISNNENMQTYAPNPGLTNFSIPTNPFSPNYLGFGDNTQAYNGYFSNANFGADLREVPTENIEKIEVVQGIPSAKYGDLTSGLVKIEQKAGKSPYKLYTSLRDGAIEYGATKGFRLGERAGNLNVSINYLESNTSPRTSYTTYERINTNAMWSWNNQKKNIKNSLSLTYGFNNDDVNYEEEDTDDKRVKNKKKDFSIANRFKWNFNETAFFDNLDANFSFNYSDHFTYESKFVNIGGTIVGTSLEEGVYNGTYTPVSYTSVKAIEGIPISSFFSADLYKTFRTENWTHNTSIGTSYRMSDNKGRGRLGNPETLIAPLANNNGQAGVGFRPYNYGENIRAEYQFSLYAEDNMTRHWDNKTLNISSGLRYDYQYGYSNLAPRINSYFSTEKFKVRGGFGLTSKAPSLNQIYTGPRYFDAVLGDYRLPGYYNLGIVQTFIDFSDNKDLKPSKSMRTELGLDYKLPFGEINITGFYNKLYDGITGEAFPTHREVAQLDVTFNGTQAPTYTISGYAPYYYLQTKLANKFLSTDKGVEFFMSFPKLPIRNVTFDVQGSYIETKNRYDVDRYLRSKDVSKPEIYGIYKPIDEFSRQFRLGSNLNYHLKKIGLVIAVRTEHFIVDENYNRKPNNPYAYLDADLNKILIPEADQNNTVLYGHIIDPQNEENIQMNRIFHNFHLRISKDFLNGFRFSFYANNFLDLKTKVKALNNGVETTRINSRLVPLSFGTRIDYQF